MEAAGSVLNCKFLIAISDKNVRAQLRDYVSGHFSSVKIFEAADGSHAVNQLERDKPDVLIIDDELARRSYDQIILSIYKDPKLRNIQTVLLYHHRRHDGFEDLVAQGSLQLVSLQDRFKPVASALYKALNRVDRGAATFRIKYIQKGELLIREGDLGNQLYIVHRGRLSAFIGDDPLAGNIGTIAQGEFVGEMAYLNNEPRSASVIAEEDSELVEINNNKFDRILYTKPSWMKALLQTLARRVRAMANRQAKAS